VAEFREFNEGSYRMVCFFMLSCLISSSSDDRGIPSLAAAPFGPATFPLLSANPTPIRFYRKASFQRLPGASGKSFSNSGANSTQISSQRFPWLANKPSRCNLK
jgi:hypothetical protein